MRVSKFWRYLSLVVVLMLVLPAAGATAGIASADEPAPLPSQRDGLAPVLDLLPSWALAVSPEAAPAPAPDPTPQPSAPLSPRFSRSTTTPAAATSSALANTVLDVFTNTWSYSTLGLVYDPGRDHVRYAHESQSSTSNPTVYDVHPVAHTAFFSFALSTVNSSWPWQLDNRTGVGYDFGSDTYFLPDYNGDLSYADDNIVEILPNGTIINAWEMDDEVGSNDSSDGSEIDSIIDIAVVPGSPPRYFVTAAYDDNVVYEVVLSKTSTLWTPNSWHTVATCTVPSIGEDSDNLGIDYDAESGVLYHSSWDTTTLVVTDLGCAAGQEMVELAAFDCPGQGGYNSGVTYIEGQGEVWVTDFSSDQTTICDSPLGGDPPPDTAWEKWVSVDGEEPEPWTPTLTVTAQTSDVIVVVDVITAVEAITLTENWTPGELRLIDWNVHPPAGGMRLQPGQVDFFFPPGPPQVVTITKWFHVEPCTWTETVLAEAVFTEDGLWEERSFMIHKWAPELSIDSEYGRYVAAGSVASFTLVYTNTGGREPGVMIRNEFPVPIAPFVFAEPWPDRLAPDGSWVEWEVGTLSNTVTGTIDVFVFISPTLPISEVVPVWDGIFNHVGDLQDEVVTEFEVASEPPPTIGWGKTIIMPDGTLEPWFPGIQVAGQVSETFIVEDTILPLDGTPFSLFEDWNPDHLRLVDVITPGYGTVITGDGWLRWEVPEGLPEEATLIKVFHIEPCMWTETLLWEELWVEGFEEPQLRPVEVVKFPSNLWIESFFDVAVYPAEEAEFTLRYGNWRGYENEVSIQNIFPPEAPFAGSDPEPTHVSPDGLEVWWVFTQGLIMDQWDTITVTVDVAEDLPPSTTIPIWDGIYNHAGELINETLIEFHVPPPEWEKWIDAPELLDPVRWDAPDVSILVLTSDTITITEVITTHSRVTLFEDWAETEEGEPGLPGPGGSRKHLTLVDYVVESDAPWFEEIREPGILAIQMNPPLPGEYVYTITKWFHVEPCTWTYTILWEELWSEGVEVERRALHLDKLEPDMVLNGAGGPATPGQEATFQLEYINNGDREFGAFISNTFPITAPFAWSDPDPVAVAPDRTWAVWDLPPLDPGVGGLITVAVDIDPTLVPSDTIRIWDGIYNHAGELEDWTWITFHVERPVWHKYVNGEPWSEDMLISAYMSDTITVTEVVYNVPDVPNVVLEDWDPEHLELMGYSATGGVVNPVSPGRAEWVIETPELGVYTLTKWFHVRPCTWTGTLLWEEFWVDGMERGQRPVPIEKPGIEMTIDSFFDVFVMAGEEATFQLEYTNLISSDIESGARITNTFPITASFAWSEPDPVASASDGTWAVWDLPVLGPGEGGVIDVAVNIDPDLLPSSTIEIWDGIYNHAGELEDWTWITFHVEPPEPAWVKEIWVDDVMHGPEEGPFPIPPDSTFVIVDRVWITNGTTISFTLTEEWAAELTLEGVDVSAGTTSSGTGWLDWYGWNLAPNTWHAITKTFHITSTDWLTSTITETLDVHYVDPQPAPVYLEFPIGRRYIYLPLVRRGS